MLKNSAEHSAEENEITQSATASTSNRRSPRRVLPALVVAVVAATLMGVPAGDPASAQASTSTTCSWIETDQGYIVGWEPHPDAAKYVVRRTVDGAGPYWRAAVLAPELSYTDTTVAGDVAYSLKLRDAANAELFTVDCERWNPLGEADLAQEVNDEGVLPVWMDEFLDTGAEPTDEFTGEAAFEDGQGIFEPSPEPGSSASRIAGRSPAFAVGAANDGDVYQIVDEVRTDIDFRHWHPMRFPVISSQPGAWKLQIEVYLSDQTVGEDLPYYKRTTPRQTSPSGVLVSAPHSFQPGYSYQWRYRTWEDGNFSSASTWTTGESFSINQASNRPGAPYPVSPAGAIGADDVILRLSESDVSQSAVGKPIASYRFEIRSAHPDATEKTVVWEATVPATQVQNTLFGQVVQVSVPAVLQADERYRWHAYAIDADGEESSPSRWRYFRTMGTAFQEENWFIPHRAGSYQAGDTGDEVSGLVASQAYPGVYWMIRDNGPGDRARLYAIKIDPATGLLSNIDGYVTKEFDVVTAANADLDGDGSPGVSNIDWEALTLDPSGRLWVADSGTYWDGASQTRPYGQFFRIPEPDPYATANFTATVDKVFKYDFPDGNTRNVEAVFSIGHHKFLIRKEGGHSVWRFPRYPSQNGVTTLDFQGNLQGTIGNVTGSEMNLDRTLFGVTTSPSVAHFWNLPGIGLDLATVDSQTAEQLIAPILTNEPDSYYYYRSAGLLEEQGNLDAARAGTPSAARQTGMQTEGLAFPINGTGFAAMVSEYGRHVMYVPPSSYEALQGEPGDNASGTLPGNQGLVQQAVIDLQTSGQIDSTEAGHLDSTLTALAAVQTEADFDGIAYIGARPDLLASLIQSSQGSDLITGLATVISPSLLPDIIKLFSGDFGLIFHQFYNPIHSAVQLDMQARSFLQAECGAPWLELERGVPGGRADFRTPVRPNEQNQFGYPAVAEFTVGEVKYNSQWSMTNAVRQLNRYYTASNLTHVDPAFRDIVGRIPNVGDRCWDLSGNTRRLFLGLPIFYRQNPTTSAETGAVIPGAMPTGQIQARIGYWVDRDYILALAGAAAWSVILEQIREEMAKRAAQNALVLASAIYEDDITGPQGQLAFNNYLTELHLKPEDYQVYAAASLAAAVALGLILFLVGVIA